MKILHLDIETAPNKVYAWGLYDQNISINQIVESGYTLCWAAKWHGASKVLFSKLETNGSASLKRKSHDDMLKAAHKLLEEADAVVHYNGTKFDIPTLNKEFILQGMKPPSPSKEIDLLKVARSRFRFPSNKLDYVAQVLGLGAKTRHKGMELWEGCMGGDPASWKVMETYNKQDVKLLEQVYIKMLPWIRNHPNYGLYLASDRPVCKNCGSGNVVKKGMEYTGVGQYQRYRCTNCGNHMRGATLQNTKEQRDRLLR